MAGGREFNGSRKRDLNVRGTNRMRNHHHAIKSGSQCRSDEDSSRRSHDCQNDPAGSTVPPVRSAQPKRSARLPEYIAFSVPKAPAADRNTMPRRQQPPPRRNTTLMPNRLRRSTFPLATVDFEGRGHSDQQTRSQSMHALIVVQSPKLANSLTDATAKFGLTPTIAADLSTAVKLFASEKYPLVLAGWGTRRHRWIGVVP